MTDRWMNSYTIMIRTTVVWRILVWNIWIISIQYNNSIHCVRRTNQPPCPTAFCTNIKYIRTCTSSHSLAITNSHTKHCYVNNHIDWVMWTQIRFFWHKRYSVMSFVTHSNQHYTIYNWSHCAYKRWCIQCILQRGEIWILICPAWWYITCHQRQCILRIMADLYACVGLFRNTYITQTLLIVI